MMKFILKKILSKPTLSLTDDNSAYEDFSDIKTPEYPSFFILDVGNKCNLRCPFCPTGSNNSDMERGFLSKSGFDTILCKISPHAKFISMVNWGEPFLNKDLLYFFSRCETLGIKTHIDSNLSIKAWSEREAEDIVTSGVDAIIGSIDGATQAGYSKYRVAGNLEIVLHNLRLLRVTRDRLSLKKPSIGWSFLINKFNENEIEAARALAADIGVDICFKLLSCGYPEWRSIYHETQDSTVLTKPEWLTRVYNIKHPQSLSTHPLHPDLANFCYQPFSAMVINWNGDVYPCCTVYGDIFKLGSLITQEFDEIWFGQEYVKCRSFLRHYGMPQSSGSVCQNNHCSLIRKDS